MNKENEKAYISAQEVFNLRDFVGCSTMEAKEALRACNGNFDESIDYIRSKGQTVYNKYPKIKRLK